MNLQQGGARRAEKLRQLLADQDTDHSGLASSAAGAGEHSPASFDLAIFSEAREALDPQEILPPGEWTVEVSGGGPGNHLAIAARKVVARAVGLAPSAGAQGPEELAPGATDSTERPELSTEEQLSVVSAREWRDRKQGATMRIILAQYRQWAIVAVHLPATRSPLSAMLWELFLEHHDWLAETPALIIGDWNTGAATDRQGNKPFTLERQFTALSSEYQWTDLWRHCHGDQRQYSWHSRAGNGFRIDHALLSPAGMALATGGGAGQIACYYDHRFREQGASDHSALRVVIEA